MPAFDVFVWLAVAALVGFQAWLTVRVFRSTLYERKQKIWQAQLIWLVPILGAGLVFSVLRDDELAERQAKGLDQSTDRDQSQRDARG